MRSIKMLGVAALVLCALSVAASSALAEEWTAKTYNARVTANQKSGEKTKFQVGSNPAVECEGTEYKSAEPEFLTGPSITILFKVLYSKCTAFGFINAEVTALSGALFLLTFPSKKTPIEVAIKGTKGGTGGFISIKVSTGCVVDVPEQVFTSGTTATNIAGGKIEAKFSIKKITYTSNKTGTGCPASNTEEATFTGNDVAEGFNELGEADEISIK